MYRNLLAEMTRNSLTYRDIAEKVDMPINTLRDKIRGITPMHIEQAFAIHREVFPDLDFFYLFKKEKKQ